MWCAVALIAGAIYLFYVYMTWNFNYWKKRGVPGPKSYPLTGSFPKSFLQKVNITDEIDTIYRTYRGSTPFVGTYSGRIPHILILDSNIAKNILVKDFKHFQENEVGDFINKDTDPILSQNVFLLKDEEWKEKRSEITPAFTASKLKAMYPIIDDVCRKFNEYLHKKSNNKSIECVDAKELASKFTVDVVSSCIYGVDSKAFTEEKSIIREMGNAIFAPSPAALVYFAVSSIFPFLKHIYQIRFVKKPVADFFTELMENAVKIRKESGIERDDFLNYLLELKKRKNINSLEMAAHTITFFLDGFETSSIVIAHVLWMLGKHKDVQQKLRDEINQTIAEKGAINFDNISDMPYLEQVFNETLRLYAPGFLISRKCTIPIEYSDYKDKKVLIEKDVIARIPVLSMHRDPEYYPDPMKFDPDRFSVENGGAKKYKEQGIFIPFSDGPRVCIGRRFATTQSKAAVCSLLRNYEVSDNSKTKEPYVVDPLSFVTMPVGGLWIDLKRI